MLSNNLVNQLQNMLAGQFPEKIINIKTIGGGSINATYKLEYPSRSLFCKVNSVTKFPHLFLKEKNGLELIERSRAIRTPGIISCIEAEDIQLLLIEWIEPGERTLPFWQNFGEQLAALHRVNDSSFGLKEDNYMGSVIQANSQSCDWISFFRQQRLVPMSKKCFDLGLLNNKHLKQFDKLFNLLPAVFDSDQKPSLLHGDLWSGNFLCNATEEPFLIDPAVYFGHPSVDLAMTTLFGGFHSSFYDAYNFHNPFAGNYKTQWKVCNLYPLLIHLYLFGQHYRMQVENILDEFN